VIEFKTATLAGLGALPTTDLRFVPIDLRKDWPTATPPGGFDTDQPTAWDCRRPAAVPALRCPGSVFDE